MHAFFRCLFSMHEILKNTSVSLIICRISGIVKRDKWTLVVHLSRFKEMVEVTFSFNVLVNLCKVMSVFLQELGFPLLHSRFDLLR